jgi:DNA-binding transcriptional ArsR family regulator
MPQTRDQIEALETHEVPVVPGTHKASVLSLLARNSDKGYEPKEIAAASSVPQNSVYKVLQRLRDDELVEKLSDHYLVNTERLDEINDMLLTSEQFAIAEDVSNENTAPSEVAADSPADIEIPDDDLLSE